MGIMNSCSCYHYFPCQRCASELEWDVGAKIPVVVLVRASELPQASGGGGGVSGGAGPRLVVSVQTTSKFQSLGFQY
jgi:hypothetical protein